MSDLGLIKPICVYRWKPVVEKHGCMSVFDTFIFVWPLTVILFSAVLRIREELGRCPPDKVRFCIL